MPRFEFPAPFGTTEIPEWTGSGFRVGSRAVSVLEYSENLQGWSDELTALHEESAGEDHPIDVASRLGALSHLKSRVSDSAATAILEVGCSSGFLLRDLTREFPQSMIIGADVVREPLLSLARSRPDIPLLRFDLNQCPLPTGSCDAVVMLNVLEHISDDDAALSQVHRVLKPGGTVVVEVPAGPHLFDAYDKALQHFRRYRLPELTAKLRDSGFSVQSRNHLGFFVYPAFAAVKRRNQRRFGGMAADTSVVSEQASGSSKSRILSLMLKAEGVLGRWVEFPVGIRCVVVARRAS